MIAALWSLGLALAAPEAPSEPPAAATLVYYNARLALRDGDATGAVKLWLLRNAVESPTGAVSPFDDDFRSLAWAALGELGLCHDGFRKDGDGARLWPLALHNHIVLTRNRGAGKNRPDAFAAFEVGRQVRRVGVDDVLDDQELRTVQFRPGPCLLPRLTMYLSGESATAKLSERPVAARVLRHLLVDARDHLDRDRVRGWAVIEARLLDLDLEIATMAIREAQRQARDAARKGRAVGLSRPAVAAAREDAPKTVLDPASPTADRLRAALDWPVDEWMRLSDDRRRYLYVRARAIADDPAAADRVGLGVVDALIAAGDSTAVDAWIGLVAPANATEMHRAVWSGTRGERLLALDGFGERSTVALHRGVEQLQRGDLTGALRSLAFARQHADASRAPDANIALSLRWIAYVAAQYRLDAELLATLRTALPRRDYGVVLETLLWSAAFHADSRSFATGLDYAPPGGALERRLEMLQPLANGDARRFVTAVAAGLKESPSETIKFIDRLVARLEVEPAETRRALLPTLERLRTVLAPLADDDRGASARTAQRVLDRIQSVIEGLVGAPADAAAGDRARPLSADAEVFAGSVRVAPADPLPWPFEAREPEPVTVFAPLELRPVEWRDAAGALVFGWSIGG